MIHPLSESIAIINCYVLVLTPPQVFWSLYMYMHEPEGAKLPEGPVHIITVPPSSFLRLQFFSILDDLSVLHAYTDN